MGEVKCMFFRGDGASCFLSRRHAGNRNTNQSYVTKYILLLEFEPVIPVVMCVSTVTCLQILTMYHD
jgi:hypothetical protein